jgi:hypothetical protein
MIINDLFKKYILQPLVQRYIKNIDCQWVVDDSTYNVGMLVKLFGTEVYLTTGQTIDTFNRSIKNALDNIYKSKSTLDYVVFVLKRDMPKLKELSKELNIPYSIVNEHDPDFIHNNEVCIRVCLPDEQSAQILSRNLIHS